MRPQAGISRERTSANIAMERLFLWWNFWIFMPSDEYHTGPIAFVTLCNGRHIPFLNRIVSGLIRCAGGIFDFRLFQTVLLMLWRARLIDTNHILCVYYIHCVGIHFEFHITIRSNENLRLSLLRHYRRHVIVDAILTPDQFRTFAFWILLYRTTACDALYDFIDFYVCLMLRLLMMLLWMNEYI